MDQLGIDAVDEIRLAGAFGSQIDPLHAMVLGLIPDCDLDHVRSAGNAAGTGALIALLSGAARDRDRGASSGASRRSRPPSSRASRSISSRRWPFPHRTAAVPAPRRGSSALPRAAPRAAATPAPTAGATDGADDAAEPAATRPRGRTD